MSAFLKDALTILNKQELKFLKSQKLSGDLHTFYFEQEKKTSWKAGQHAIFTVPGKNSSKSTRPFSLSSSPDEQTVALTTRISETPSSFKQALLDLKPGDPVAMRGPVGPLYISDDSPSLLIAGGIGITPFRSILKHRSSQNSYPPVRLLYIDTDETFLFKGELDEFKADPNTEIFYLTSRDALYSEIKKFIQESEGAGKFYIGGSKTMVKSISAFLKDHGISKKMIRKDPFYGL